LVRPGAGLPAGTGGDRQQAPGGARRAGQDHRRAGDVLQRGENRRDREGPDPEDHRHLGDPLLKRCALLDEGNGNPGNAGCEADLVQGAMKGHEWRPRSNLGTPSPQGEVVVEAARSGWLVALLCALPLLPSLVVWWMCSPASTESRMAPL